jgi:hypothetical protein
MTLGRPWSRDRDDGGTIPRDQEKWLTWRHHAPSDVVAQPVDEQASGQFDVLVARVLERIANRDSRPRRKDSSFFKRFAEWGELKRRRSSR